MSTQQKSSGSIAINIVAGVILMLAGAWADKNIHLGFVESLEHMGLPLGPFKAVATIGVFLIVFPLIKLFFTDPLKNAINERNSNLEQTFSEAESLRAEMTKMRSDYEARLVAAEASAREHIEAQIKEAQKLRQTVMNEAASRADAMIEKAQQEIAAERERILTGLRTQVVELSLVAAERIVGENMDTERNRRLVDEFVNGLEVKH
jgi:F-type H+-transporting ATPase subunit b